MPEAILVVDQARAGTEMALRRLTRGGLCEDWGALCMSRWEVGGMRVNLRGNLYELLPHLLLPLFSRWVWYVPQHSYKKFGGMLGWDCDFRGLVF
jgi:hypothetical protein